MIYVYVIKFFWIFTIHLQTSEFFEFLRLAGSISMNKISIKFLVKIQRTSVMKNLY